jgi:hypothetical protein
VTEFSLQNASQISFKHLLSSLESWAQIKGTLKIFAKVPNLKFSGLLLLKCFFRQGKGSSNALTH